MWAWVPRWEMIPGSAVAGASGDFPSSGIPVCAMIRSRQGWWGDAVRTEHPVLSEKRPPTVIGNDVWIGDGAVILEGVTVGDGAVIASLALVAASVPEGALVCGNPGHIAGYRYEKAFPWWNYGSALLEKTDFSLLSGREDFFRNAAEMARHQAPVPLERTGFLLSHRQGICSVWRTGAEGKKLCYQIPCQ